MAKSKHSLVNDAKKAALEVLLHNMHGPFDGLPRTAGWGYPEPYTRDLLISALGIFVSGNEELIESIRRVLSTLAKNQSPHGHIPSLVHDPRERGASDTTPLFLLATAFYRRISGERNFLAAAVKKALTWMDYQSPDDRVMVAQLPTSDWRDELWVLGYPLFVNTLAYAYLREFGYGQKAKTLRRVMSHRTLPADVKPLGAHEGLAIPRRSHYASWSYKIYEDERLDLLGNSLAILTGLAPPSRADALIAEIQNECEQLRNKGELKLPLPPCLFPYIEPGTPDWRPRYLRHNLPGEYHNGGVWPFVCGFYIAALVAAGRSGLAGDALDALTELVRPAREQKVSHGFNEWFSAKDGMPRGQDWQTWSAGMYLYAAECVERGSTPFFDQMRRSARKSSETRIARAKRGVRRAGDKR